MKKILCLALALLMLFSLGGGLTASAASGSLSASASSSTVTVGNIVTVTLQYNGGGGTIGALTAGLSYNARAFEYVSASGDIAVSGNAGVLQLSYYAPGAQAPSAVSVKLTFKAIAVGAGSFSATTSEFINDADYTSLGAPAKTLAVNAVNPTKSANANLASIKPSSGTLTPAFNPNVTSYTISVPYTTTSLSLSVTTQDKGAKTAVSGKNALVVGKNTQTITVTAPNGSTKKYTVVITRAAGQTTTGTTGTTQPKPDPLEVEVNGTLLTVVDTQPNVPLPQGFSWESVTINNIHVSAAINKTVNMTLVYLTNPTDKTGAFYIYNEQDGKFSPFSSLKVAGGDYILLALPAGQIPPTGTVRGKQLFGDIEHDVFLFEDTALADVAIVYAIAPSGKTGLYLYDKTDGSMQLYRTFTAPTAPPTTTAPAGGPFGQFVNQNRSLILICSAAAGGLALLIAAVTLLLIIIARSNKGGKH